MYNSINIHNDYVQNKTGNKIVECDIWGWEDKVIYTIVSSVSVMWSPVCHTAT